MNKAIRRTRLRRTASLAALVAATAIVAAAMPAPASAQQVGGVELMELTIAIEDNIAKVLVLMRNTGCGKTSETNEHDDR